MQEGPYFDELAVGQEFGGALSLGHPIAATGARMLATGLRELRRRGGRYLLATMCVGGGQGVAAVFEAAYARQRQFMSPPVPLRGFLPVPSVP